MNTLILKYRIFCTFVVYKRHLTLWVTRRIHSSAHFNYWQNEKKKDINAEAEISISKQI